jgi:cysteinyl-tRNA synthetase
MNITDVDDKIIRNAVARGMSLGEYTEVYTKAFLDDCATLRLERPERIARATEHIAGMAAAIHKLEEQGHTYRSDGSVYFRISTFPGYGKLSHNDFSGMVAGALFGRRQNPVSRRGTPKWARGGLAGTSSAR